MRLNYVTLSMAVRHWRCSAMLLLIIRRFAYFCGPLPFQRTFHWLWLWMTLMQPSWCCIATCKYTSGHTVAMMAFWCAEGYSLCLAAYVGSRCSRVHNTQECMKAEGRVLVHPPLEANSSKKDSASKEVNSECLFESCGFFEELKLLKLCSETNDCIQSTCHSN